MKRLLLTLNHFFFDLEDVEETDYLRYAPLLLWAGPSILAVLIFFGMIIYYV